MPSIVEREATVEMKAYLADEAIPRARSSLSKILGEAYTYKQRLLRTTVAAYSEYIAVEVGYDLPAFSDFQGDKIAAKKFLQFLDLTESGASDEEVLKAANAALKLATKDTLIQNMLRISAKNQIAYRTGDTDLAREALDLVQVMTEALIPEFTVLDIGTALGDRTVLLESPQASPAGMMFSTLLHYGDFSSFVLGERATYIDMLDREELFAQLAVRGQVLKSPIPLLNMAEILYLKGLKGDATAALMTARTFDPELAQLLTSARAQVLETEFLTFALDALRTQPKE